MVRVGVAGVRSKSGASGRWIRLIQAALLLAMLSAGPWGAANAQPGEDAFFPWTFSQAFEASGGFGNPDSAVDIEGDLMAVALPAHWTRIVVYLRGEDGAWAEAGSYEVFQQSYVEEGDDGTLGLGGSGRHVSVDVDGSRIGVAVQPQPQTRGWAGILRWDGQSLVLESQLVPAAGMESLLDRDHFGASIQVSGDLAFVGASGSGEVAREGPGAVYVFREGDGVWGEEAQLEAGDTTEHDDFGSALAYSDGLLAVGAPAAWGPGGSKVPGTQNHGGVYLFEEGEGGWELFQHLEAPDAHYHNGFGARVSMQDGVLAATGETLAADVRDRRGVVYVFQHFGDVWDATATVTLAETFQAGDWELPPAMDGEIVELARISGDVEVVDGSVVASSVHYPEGGSLFHLMEGEDGWAVRSTMGMAPRYEHSFGQAVAAHGRTLVVTDMDISYAGPHVTYLFEGEGWMAPEVGRPQEPEPCPGPRCSPVTCFRADGANGCQRPCGPSCDPMQEMSCEPDHCARPCDAPCEPACADCEASCEVDCRRMPNTAMQYVVEVRRGGAGEVVVPLGRVELTYEASRAPGVVSASVASDAGELPVDVDGLRGALTYVHVEPTRVESPYLIQRPEEIDLRPEPADLREAVRIEISYTASELREAGVDESDLALHFWTGHEWVELEGGASIGGSDAAGGDLLVLETGADVRSDVVWAIVNHTSTYALAPRASAGDSQVLDWSDGLLVFGSIAGIAILVAGGSVYAARGVSGRRRR